MSDFTRRDVVKIGVGLAAGSALGGPALAQSAPEWKIQPEKGASLRIMRPAKFVQGDVMAGFVITMINIVGGLIIGVWQRGEPIAEAGRLVSAVVPHLMEFVPPRPLLMDAEPGVTLAVYLGLGAVKAVAWSVLLMAVACAIFRKRDFL